MYSLFTLSLPEDQLHQKYMSSRVTNVVQSQLIKQLRQALTLYIHNSRGFFLRQQQQLFWKTN